MSRLRFGVTRRTPSSVRGLVSLPAVRLVLAFEAAAVAMLALARR